MLLRPIRVNQDRIDDYADDCMRILFDTWRTKNFFPPCPYLADKYLASEDLMLVPKCIPRILQQRSQEGTGRTCEICGQMLPYVTQNDINNYTRHQKKHKFETWKCSCDATFSGYKETERHVKLYHSKGDYIQCEKCISVMQRKYMAKHLDQCHRDFICNVCGKICHNSNALRVHGLDHKPYQCKTCFEQMIGVTRWRAHKKNSPHCFM